MNSITKSIKTSNYRYISYAVILSLIAIYIAAGFCSEPLTFWIKTTIVGIFIFLTLITDMVVEGHQQKDRFSKVVHYGCYFEHLCQICRTAVVL